MSTYLGKQAVVVGAGMGGLTAAQALADFFEQVTVLENDPLPAAATHRPGTPQCRHAHALLVGGQQALGTLFPGFEQNLSRAGAVPLRVSSDFRVERPGYNPFPQRDLGLLAYAISRPLIELTVRKRVEEQSNIELRDRCRVQRFVTTPDATEVTAVRFEHSDGRGETLPADLVVDASGHGKLTLNMLESNGQPRPDETLIGVDLGYASAILDIPDDAPSDWRTVITFAQFPRNRRGGIILPLEGNRWIVSLGGRRNDKPPDDWGGFLSFAQQLRTPTIYNAIKHANLVGEIARFVFRASSLRHFELLETFPRGLLPFGDTLCRFNPLYGQGMSVAALEACHLRCLLGTQDVQKDGLAGLASAFFDGAKAIIETPWVNAAIPDFVDPDTPGQRPPDLEKTLRFLSALFKLAAEDPAVHKLVAEVQHLLKPQSVYRDPDLVQRVEALMTVT
ncbi:MAG TPA: FAD-dependent oxidoreductase [Candidatus Acidoferrales bacterium]|nr:FAD-dependent oxidoreductase [Candidatus Acidoferrales bacterium]